MALTNKLVAIADAIREKGSTTEKLTLDAMPAAITALQTGGGSGDDWVPNPINFSGVCSYTFYQNRWKWVLDRYSDRMTSANITDAKYMFAGTDLPNGIPFDVNFQESGANCEYMFNRCALPDEFTLSGNMDGRLGSIKYMFSDTKVKKLPSMKQSQADAYYEAGSWLSNSTVEEIGDLQLHIQTFSELFRGATYLRHIPDIVLTSPNIHTYRYATASNIFTGCYSLRTISKAFLKEMYNTVATGSSYILLKGTFNGLCCLDEIDGLSPRTPELTSNVFVDTFKQCYRLKRIVFDTDNGTPYKASWKNQTISLYDGVGWLTGTDVELTRYASGITEAKKVTDEITYEALKNDPDWYTNHPRFSRFNHDSAVEFINSLPDTSEYLATQSGATNTIQFRNYAGEDTDGGSIGNLTEEEIAVAAAKGWTITYKT